MIRLVMPKTLFTTQDNKCKYAYTAQLKESPNRPRLPLHTINFANMALATTLPKEVSRLGQEIKLFGKWDTQEYLQFYMHARVGVDLHISSKRRGERHLINGLHPSSARRVSPTHSRPICQETIQEGADAHRRALGR
jgi:hypothetical protein